MLSCWIPSWSVVWFDLRVSMYCSFFRWVRTCWNNIDRNIQRESIHFSFCRELFAPIIMLRGFICTHGPYCGEGISGWPPLLSASERPCDGEACIFVAALLTAQHVSSKHRDILSRMCLNCMLLGWFYMITVLPYADSDWQPPSCEDCN